MKNIERHDKLIGMVVLGIVLVAVLILGIRLWHQKKVAPVVGEEAAPAVSAPQPPVVLDYARIEEDAQLKALMQQRKEGYGINKGLDMIAKPEESIKIGEATVSLKEIIDKIKLAEGKIVENEIDRTPASGGMQASAAKEDVYGSMVI